MYIMEEEKEVKITLVPREWTSTKEPMYRISCKDMLCGCGVTLVSAIKDFDEKNNDDTVIQKTVTLEKLAALPDAAIKNCTSSKELIELISSLC